MSRPADRLLIDGRSVDGPAVDAACRNDALDGRAHLGIVVRTELAVSLVDAGAPSDAGGSFRSLRAVSAAVVRDALRGVMPAVVAAPSTWTGYVLVGAVLLGAALVGCAPAPPTTEETLLVFGSTSTIRIHDPDPARNRAAIGAVAGRLAALEQEWHAWKPSALTELNAALAAGETARVPEQTERLLQRVAPYVKASQGLFDPTLGGLLDLWGFYTDEFPIVSPEPTAAQLDAWLQTRPSFDDLVSEGHTLRSTNPAARIDLAAVAEGAAAEIVFDELARAGIRHALLAMGGDVATLGDAGGRPWRVAIRDPIGGADEVLGVATLAGGEALFVSGNYARFRIGPDGARWPHILDPRSGRPARGVATAVVLGRDPVRADALVTALMVGGVPRFAELLEAFGESCALLLTDQNELLITRGMLDRLELHRQPVLLGRPLELPGDCAGPG